MSKTLLRKYEFSDSGRDILALESKGRDWPVVYLFYNEKELYVGESSNMLSRFKQHRDNPLRKDLRWLNVLYDEELNKSAALDIEQSLIQLFSAEKKFTLQNLNAGQSSKHNYYQREKYLDKVNTIWVELGKAKLTEKSVEELRNSDLFKFSPYCSLTPDQAIASNAIIDDIIENLSRGKKGAAVIHGSVGTGKTVVMINAIYRISIAQKFEYSFSEDDDISESFEQMRRIKEFLSDFKARKGRNLKIGFVVPMTSLRSTLKKVFKQIEGLSGNMIIGPFDVVDGNYDVVFVDESHRLTRYKNIANSGAFVKAAKAVSLDYTTCSQLDIIRKKTDYQVLVYDESQSVKGSDLTNEQFYSSLEGEKKEIYLQTQLRCRGGSSYVSYVESILDCSCKERQEVSNFDICLFDDPNKMIQEIKNLEKEHGLCRIVAGYSWPWKTKNEKDFKKLVERGEYDIELNGKGYVWNMTNKEFIIQPDAINQIGCIHTVQGYDLNYVGVIFGREIDYDFEHNRLVIHKELFFDINVKKGADDDTLKQYLVNTYKVLMTRGIRGCYLYACNENMKKYLSRFFSLV